MDTRRGEKSMAVGVAGQREKSLDGVRFCGDRVEHMCGRPGPECRECHLQEGVKAGNEYR